MTSELPLLIGKASLKEGYTSHLKRNKTDITAKSQQYTNQYIKQCYMLLNNTYMKWIRRKKCGLNEISGRSNYLNGLNENSGGSNYLKNKQ